MSLDVRLTVTQPTTIFTHNITHNLGRMAQQVVLSNGLTLYNILWRPDECDPPLLIASDIAEMLDEAFGIMLEDRPRLERFNPENGWGRFESLIQLVIEYRNAGREYPTALIEVCR